MRFRFITALAFGLLTLMSTQAVGHTPLPAEVILTRMSLKLTGRLPPAAEVQRFKRELQANPQDVEQIISRTINSYMESREFFGAMDRFHAVWFRVPVRESSKLAAHIVMNDRPYFEIFDKDYLFANGEMQATYQNTGASFSGNFPTSNDEWEEVRLTPGEERFRSILSNLDILNRYPDTPTNRNRSRANFIFRTFMCETLSPPVKKNPPSHFANDDDHGTNPDCIGCHYRLDPMARFFDHWRPAVNNSTWFDSDQIALGKLVLPVAGQPPVSFPGDNETGLARILAAQPLVHSCISSKSWEFIYGVSVEIPEAFKPVLINAFDQRNSFRDAIRTSMLHPYFWSTTTPPPITYASVAPILAACGSCHTPEKNLGTIFDPAIYPYDQDPGKNVALLAKIYGAINHRDGFYAMPKAPRPKLPTESLGKIRDWVLSGGNDNNGNSTLSSEDIERVIDEQF